jgi:hypothetical protein
VRRFAGVGVPNEARLVGVIGRTDVTIYAFHRASPKAVKNKYMDPHVASPSSFATLRISPAGSEHPRKPEIWLSGDPSDARKTAQPQGDTLE